MSSIYSVPLGNADLTGTGVVLLYTVPVSGGPAIIRSITAFADSGNVGVVLITRSGVTMRVAAADASAIPGTLFESYELYQPLEPGDTISAECFAYSGGNLSFAVGGYQFSTP